MGYVDKALLPPPPPYCSEQFCHSHLLWFKIMTLTAQTTQLVRAKKNCGSTTRQTLALRKKEKPVPFVYCKNQGTGSSCIESAFLTTHWHYTGIIVHTNVSNVTTANSELIWKIALSWWNNETKRVCCILHRVHETHKGVSEGSSDISVLMCWEMQYEQLLRVVY